MKQGFQLRDRRRIHRVGIQPAGADTLGLQLQLRLDLTPGETFLQT